MRQIINHFTDDDLYKLTMCCAVIDNFPRAHVCYQFVDRDDTVYPDGFAREVEHQIELLESVIITQEEIDFLRRKCNYLPEWFLTYLRGFRFSRDWVKVWQTSEGHLHIEFEGLWADTILLEVKVLAIVSELFYMFNEQAQSFDYQLLYDKTYHKTERLLEAGCVFSDFGTRRRASLKAEEIAVRAMKDCYESKAWKGKVVGTSNIHLAMKYDLMPVGTMAHEFICAIGGMFGPQMANYMAMEAWRKTYRGALGTYLYDSFGWDIFSYNFSEDFANQFKGLRIDSGDNHEQLDKIIAKYKSFGIDARDFFIKKNKKAVFPEDFLKRWLRVTNEKMTDEAIEKDFDRMLEYLKWDIIKKLFVEKYEIKIEDKDVREAARQDVLMRFAQYGINNPQDDILNTYVEESLKQKGAVEQFYQQAVEKTVITKIKENVALNPKEVTMEEFNKLFAEK